MILTPFARWLLTRLAIEPLRQESAPSLSHFYSVLRQKMLIFFINIFIVSICQRRFQNIIKRILNSDLFTKVPA